MILSKRGREDTNLEEAQNMCVSITGYARFLKCKLHRITRPFFVLATLKSLEEEAESHYF
jgi:hypothetical protein